MNYLILQTFSTAICKIMPMCECLWNNELENKARKWMLLYCFLYSTGEEREN